MTIRPELKCPACGEPGIALGAFQRVGTMLFVDGYQCPTVDCQVETFNVMWADDWAEFMAGDR